MFDEAGWFLIFRFNDTAYINNEEAANSFRFHFPCKRPINGTLNKGGTNRVELHTRTRVTA